METRVRRKRERPEDLDYEATRQGSEPEASEDTNQARRRLYRNNPEYREQAKERSRKNYRSRNPKKAKVVDIDTGVEPTDKEVYKDGHEDRVICKRVFTIPESAKYLGKSPITFKKWITDRIIPPPIWLDTSYGYYHYDLHELQSIATALRRHEKDYSYLHHTHDVTINSIWQAIEAYRK